MTNPQDTPAWVSGGADEPDPLARQYAVTAPDGRTIQVAEYGPEDGSPIISIHGTPGSRYGGPPPDKPDLYERLGVRSIGFDRSGYGLSTPRPGRRAVDAADDVAAIAQHLGLTSVAVTGGSGGGPHCLAAAAKLPALVTRVACIVGVAPFGAEGLPRDEWLDGMTKGNVDEFSWAIAGEQELRKNLQRLASEELKRVAVDPSSALGEEYELADSDREIMARPEHQTRIKRMLQESYRQGVDGWVDDDLLFVRPWGFEVSEVGLPAMVWFGVNDTLVPPAHGEWLAKHVPGARVLRMSGGHMELVDRVEELVTWLIGGDEPRDATAE